VLVAFIAASVDMQFLIFEKQSMPITKQKKNEIIENLSDKFSRAKTIVFLGFQGLKVKESTEIRRKFRSENVDYKVAKKTLIKKSLEKAGIENIDDAELTGPVAVAIGYDDEVVPAKVANECSKTNEKLKILGGIVMNKYKNTAEIEALALLPNKDQLRASFIATVNSPVTGFVNVLRENIRGLVNVLRAVSEKKK